MYKVSTILVIEKRRPDITEHDCDSNGLVPRKMFVELNSFKSSQTGSQMQDIYYMTV